MFVAISDNIALDYYWFDGSYKGCSVNCEKSCIILLWTLPLKIFLAIYVTSTLECYGFDGSYAGCRVNSEKSYIILLKTLP